MDFSPERKRFFDRRREVGVCEEDGIEASFEHPAPNAIPLAAIHIVAEATHVRKPVEDGLCVDIGSVVNDDHLELIELTLKERGDTLGRPSDARCFVEGRDDD